MSTDPKTLSAALRQQAAELRKEAAEIDKRKVVKCAQVLTAARGLTALKKIIEGGH